MTNLAGTRLRIRLTNGISAVVGVFFGNPFAPTIYIGHPGWKAMGARVGYSVLNAVAVTAGMSAASTRPPGASTRPAQVAV